MNAIDNTIEYFIPIEEYAGYEVSNFGRIKSFKKGKEIIMSPRIAHNGYYFLGVYRNGKQKTIKVHQLVAMVFLGHTPCGMKWVINHKDGNKLNNHVDNIEIVTPRQNSHDYRKPAGCYWRKKDNKWASEISINGKQKWLGYSNTFEEGQALYQKALAEVV